MPADRKRVATKPKELIVVEAPPPKRQRKAPADKAHPSETVPATTKGPATPTSANHNKYCHFCQHVKVRASRMFACENQECCRRFCKHCLTTHLNEDVDSKSTDAWKVVDGKPAWFCPICRNKCCCSVSDCAQEHRHCKAYRYRRRRAEQASQRMAAIADKCVGKKTRTKPPARPVIDLSATPADKAGTQIGSSWPSSAGSATSAWSAADTEAADMDAHSDAATPEEDIPEPTADGHDSWVSAVWADEASAAPAVNAAMADEELKEVNDFCSMWDTRDHEEEQLLGGDELEAEMRGMYGIGGAVPDLVREEDEELKRYASTEDVDEAQWLRGTYEHLYRPESKQKALVEAVSRIGKAKEHPLDTLTSFATAPQPARKCTVMYDFV